MNDIQTGVYLCNNPNLTNLTQGIEENEVLIVSIPGRAVFLQTERGRYWEDIDAFKLRIRTFLGTYQATGVMGFKRRVLVLGGDT